MMRLLARPWLDGRDRESAWAGLISGLYWHFPLCCVVAYVLRHGKLSPYPGIYGLHPDRTIKAWSPCRWHDSHPPQRTTRDWLWAAQQGNAPVPMENWLPELVD